MTQLAEQFGTPDAPADSGKCPFCTSEKNVTYKTYPGAENNSDILEKIMTNPARLLEMQPECRPKSSATKDEGQNRDENEYYDDASKARYSTQAHHIISGNQIMGGEPIETFIKKGDLIKADTGYSINNHDNGIWLPSKPYDRPWPGAATDPDWAERLSIARRPMEKGMGQWHLGPHNIAAPVGVEAENGVDQTYV